MTKNNSSTSRKELTLLRQRLAQVESSWAVDDYKSSVIFFTKILPKIMGVERCTIFIMEMGSNRICSMFGTGLSEMQIEPPMDGSLVGKVISTNQSIIENDLSSHHGFHVHVAEQTGFISNNMLCSPIKSSGGNNVSGAVQILNKTNGSGFSAEDQKQLEEIANVLSISIESIVLNQEILRIADYLEKEVHRLEQNSVKGTLFIAESPAMLEILELVKVVSNTPVNVMILGENGTGKELIARMIHEKGQRKKEQFIPVNCACLPENLVESEFFGHERGAFTGADKSRKGRFEEASGGTLFLDEIAEMPLTIQPKFLRAIQEQEGSRLGSNKQVLYDLRLISATNKDISLEVSKGNFREDLFFRLFSVEITIPPLRKRPEDILPLSLHFLTVTNKHFQKQVVGFSSEVLDLFERYNWPGNVRQLMKEIERLVALTPNNEIIQIHQCSKDLLKFHKNQPSTKAEALTLSFSIPEQVEALEKELITKALKRSDNNKTKAAQLLNLTRQGLLKKMKRYNMV